MFPTVLEYNVNHCWDEEQECSNDYGIMIGLFRVVVGIFPPTVFFTAFLFHKPTEAYHCYMTKLPSETLESDKEVILRRTKTIEIFTKKKAWEGGEGCMNTAELLQLAPFPTAPVHRRQRGCSSLPAR